ncbi:hypothetical protein [Hydrogenophaga sp.]|jgi:hypothetical protein|uniref:hypothetical protein n=1 Tax=Hydrogenophaga sp. TaxID=1904254 RepID=UPI0027334AEA|nr:hypothetical protein [Hydrogenophaga sp.]MDP3887006.1 hypothetical protein [Hydrogenophaga sp.]
MSLTNPYARWLALQPPKRRQVGTVLAMEGGVATIELPSGGRLQAVGQASVGDRVFVRDGLIEGEAPNLTYISAEV